MRAKTRFSRQARRFLRDTRGATAIEYGLLCAVLIVALIGVLHVLYGRIGGTFNTISNGLNGP